MRYYVTVLDHRFLPQLLALYESLEKYAGDFKLFTVCVDELIAEQLDLLNLQNLIILPLANYETPELLEAKKERSHGEYCWTLASHTFSFVKKHSPDINQVTYLDCDLYFFDDPEILLQELDKSDQDILITEHAFAPEYQEQAEHGRFCVQFLTVNYTKETIKVIEKWQEQCRQWCGSDVSEGKFGDQAYLDQWPKLYPETVHILVQVKKTLAPWNLNHYWTITKGEIPVFFHFHGFRMISEHWAFLVNKSFTIDSEAFYFYRIYFKALKRAFKGMKKLGIPRPFFPTKHPHMHNLRYAKRALCLHNYHYFI